MTSLDETDRIELIDPLPADLTARLQAVGKVYIPGDMDTAADRRFREPNLTSLRELARRRIADRGNAPARASCLWITPRGQQ